MKNGALEVVTTSNMKPILTVHPLICSAASNAFQAKRRRLIHSLLLAAALATQPLFASTSKADAPSPFLDFDLVTIGTHRSQVTERIGDPSDKFSADVWIYWDYRDPRRAADERYKTVIIIFADNSVARIRFTDTKATRAALAKFRHDQALMIAAHTAPRS